MAVSETGAQMPALDRLGAGCAGGVGSHGGGVGGPQIAGRFTVGHVCSSCICERLLPGNFFRSAKGAALDRQGSEPADGWLVPGCRLTGKMHSAYDALVAEGD